MFLHMGGGIALVSNSWCILNLLVFGIVYTVIDMSHKVTVDGHSNPLPCKSSAGVLKLDTGSDPEDSEG